MTEANIHYPTDTGILADGVKAITRTVGKLRKLAEGVGKGFRTIPVRSRRRAWR